MLSNSETAIFFGLLSRIVASENSAWPKPERLSWQTTLNDLLTQMPREQLIDLRKGLFFLQWIAPAFVPTLPPFTKRDASNQDRILRSLEYHRSSRLRGAFEALKGLCCLVYFSQPQIWPAMGYQGPLKSNLLKATT